MTATRDELIQRMTAHMQNIMHKAQEVKLKEATTAEEAKAKTIKHLELCKESSNLSIELSVECIEAGEWDLALECMRDARAIVTSNTEGIAQTVFNAKRAIQRKAAEN